MAIRPTQSTASGGPPDEVDGVLFACGDAALQSTRIGLQPIQ
jgi:hypothetical protein